MAGRDHEVLKPPQGDIYGGLAPVDGADDQLVQVGGVGGQAGEVVRRRRPLQAAVAAAGSGGRIIAIGGVGEGGEALVPGEVEVGEGEVGMVGHEAGPTVTGIVEDAHEAVLSLLQGRVPGEPLCLPLNGVVILAVMVSQEGQLGAGVIAHPVLQIVPVIDARPVVGGDVLLQGTPSPGHVLPPVGAASIAGGGKVGHGALGIDGGEEVAVAQAEKQRPAAAHRSTPEVNAVQVYVELRAADDPVDDLFQPLLSIVADQSIPQGGLVAEQIAEAIPPGVAAVVGEDLDGGPVVV